MVVETLNKCSDLSEKLASLGHIGQIERRGYICLDRYVKVESCGLLTVPNQINKCIQLGSRIF